MVLSLLQYRSQILGILELSGRSRPEINKNERNLYEIFFFLLKLIGIFETFGVLRNFNIYCSGLVCQPLLLLLILNQNTFLLQLLETQPTFKIIQRSMTRKFLLRLKNLGIFGIFMSINKIKNFSRFLLFIPMQLENVDACKSK